MDNTPNNYLHMSALERLVWAQSLTGLWYAAGVYDRQFAGLHYAGHDYVPVWAAAMQHIRWLLQHVATDDSAFMPDTLAQVKEELEFLNQIAAIHATGGKA